MIIITFNNLYLRFLKIVQSHISKVKIHVLNDTQGKVSFSLMFLMYSFRWHYAYTSKLEYTITPLPFST